MRNFRIPLIGVPPPREDPITARKLPPIRSEVFSISHLEDHARLLAARDEIDLAPRESHRLLARLENNRKVLYGAQRRIASVVRQGKPVTPAAEWLLDNFYIVQEQLRQIEQDLSHSYYHELPKLANGQYVGYPRVYSMALAIIEHTDSHLDSEVITRFVQAYQSNAALTLGELWAVAIMLRLGLIENLRRIMEQSLEALDKRDVADTLAQSFIRAPKQPAEQFIATLVEITRSPARLDPIFTVHLLQHLRDADPAVVPIIHWLEERLREEGTTVEEIVRAEHLRRATNRVSVSNIITSMRTLSILDWPLFVEETSRVEQVLRTDPADIYAHMDFATRDVYRHAVERIGKHARDNQNLALTQEAVARSAIELARQAPSATREAHVGYYLIGRGLPQLEARAGYRPTPRERISRAARAHPSAFYLGLLGAITLLLWASVLAYTLSLGAAWPVLALIALLALIPAVSVAEHVLNWTLTTEIQPKPLPKLEFKDEIPAAFRTMVVVPALISSSQGIARLIEGLEVRYLANRDPHLHFALLGDFADAHERERPEDSVLLEEAIRLINLLNERHGNGRADRFYLFHRTRTWNEGEQLWMGWERKRGKLMEFNRLLRGANDTHYSVQIGDLSILPHVKFVITLDADTELPLNAAKRLIGTLAHPLNRPVLDPRTRRVLEGYSILQPRTAVTALAASDTRFTELFAGDTGLDPYSAAASDVYQDLFGAGIYVGKGIYDVDAFEAALEGRFPQNLLLSHDLLESTFARAGLASDIQLLEDYPSGYDAYVQRNHRWVRGDWQITDWLFPMVRDASGQRVRNPLPPIERWKIFDNLLRSLLPLALLALLVAGWLLLPSAMLFWLLAALFPLFLPNLIGVAAGISVHPHGETWRAYLLALRREVWIALKRTFYQIAFMVHHAAVNLNAILTVFVRRVFTHRKLLEWTSAAVVERGQARTLGDYWLRMWASPLVASALWITLFAFDPSMLALSLPLLALWWFAPFLAYHLSQRRVQAEQPLPDEAVAFLRVVARKIWRFYATFADAYDHYLPPDNYQEDPNPVVAHRTSPTNIGFLLLSTVAAYDFGYVGVRELAERLEQTLNTLNSMERYRGHFYNWYDTTTLHPLMPQYVSTVDSGNLAASLYALKQACYEMGDGAVLPPLIVRGVQDTVMALQESLRKLALLTPAVEPLCKRLEVILEEAAPRMHEAPRSLSGWLTWLRELDALCLALDAPKHALDHALGSSAIRDIRYWCDALEHHARVHRTTLEQMLPWAPALEEWRHWADNHWGEQQASLSGLHARLLAALDRVPSLRDLAEGCAVSAELLLFEKEAKETTLADAQSSALREWLSSAQEQLRCAQHEAQQLLTRYENVARSAETMARAMDFTFLFDTQREIFTIGFNASAHRRDESFYDLLASECRLASLVAIAEGQVPPRHWFRMGRPLTHAAGNIALLSWGGTMFEYLMPTLLMRTYDHTLLNQTVRAVVRRQMQYAKKLGVPWGISESGFYAFDYMQNYQYRLFGVPDLGLKRDQGENLVVAPYATFLALAVAPNAVWDNLQHLAREGGSNGYGYYEAIDYTPARRPKDQRSGIVRSFMAHHQGMSLLALDNFLNGDPMQRRFHAEPIISATEVLLQEKMPRHAPVIMPHPDEITFTPGDVELSASTRRFTTPHTSTPRAQLLSNGSYTVMLTNAGGGYSAHRSVHITRWRQDITRDNWGTFIYFKDLQRQRVWSMGYQPLCAEPDDYEVQFLVDRAIFQRHEAGIETRVEIAVSPQDNIEVRRVLLTNHGRGRRELELTSYGEIALDAHAADSAHPAFSKLFIESEFLREHAGLLFKRRPRSAEQLPTWAMHRIVVEDQPLEGLSYETDRAKFLGRGNSARDPDALHGKLSNTTGAVLDPIMSLRCRVRLDAGERAVVSFVTGMADSREHALALLETYGDPRSIERVFDLSSVHAQVRHRHLGISTDEAHLFQRLASRVLYPDPVLRAASEVLASNTRSQSALWAYGISGDYPIMLLRVDEESETSLVRQALLAHEYWRLHNFSVDLVILNGFPTGYAGGLQERLQGMIDTSLSRPWLDKPGGVFLRRRDQMRAEDVTLLETVARVILDGALGTLADQLDRSQPLKPSARIAEKPMIFRPRPQRALPAPSADANGDLQFFNGLGGFNAETGEYVIQLRDGMWTPTPWINVLANEKFGCLVSEAGLGYSWALNSQQNRLTPWSNDPVSDTPSEAFYLHDDDSGELWSPTPLPIRKAEPYTIAHGAGYSRFTHQSHGLAHELLVFVPNDEPLKVLRLTLRNTSEQTRRMTLTYYLEWVLGFAREQNQFYIVTEMDAAHDALYARNSYNTDFSGRIGFVAASAPLTSFTTDRMEFIGRNGSLQEPAALSRTHLSGLVGAGLDPCAALQVRVDLEPRQDKEIVFVLGEAQSKEEARALIAAYRGRVRVAAAFDAVQARWRELLGTVQVQTPDAAMNALLNRWLLYQALACRVWARAAFYQSGGAYGYRDQLQDVMALVYAAPQLTREQIVRAAGHQFIEGDVQHWWHPPSNAGVRTRFSDDYLWLPYVTAHYVQAAHDEPLLDEQVPFLSAPLLEPQQHEVYLVPTVSDQTGSIYEHCARAIDLALSRFGAHDLPLMGIGDWNDGMNRVGSEGKGESVWVGWFLYAILTSFAPLAARRGDDERARMYAERAAALQRALDAHGWDGEWYRRAYFDDGTPLGSAQNDECQIDSIAQSWSIISGAGDAARAQQAMRSLEKHLVNEQDELMHLLTPPFDKGKLDPGYIKGYVPGIRENGAQYTHAALWVLLAYVQLGEGTRAAQLFQLLNPLNHALTPEAVARYKVEPYVIAADVYAHPQHVGRGGWTWYTGSASWMYRVGVEGILGLKRRGAVLCVEPCIPAGWPRYQVTYRYGTSMYEISVENPEGVQRGVARVEVNGVLQDDGNIPLVDDGQRYRVRVLMGAV